MSQKRVAEGLLRENDRVFSPPTADNSAYIAIADPKGMG